MQRILLAITALLITLTSVAQETRRDESYRALRGRDGAVIPAEARWFNHKRAFTVFDLKDQLAMIHFWDFRDPGAAYSIAQLNALHESSASFVGLTVLCNVDAAQMTDAQVQSIIRQHRINHPVIIAEDLSSFNLAPEVLSHLPAVLAVDERAVQTGPFLNDQLYLLTPVAQAMLENMKTPMGGMYQFSAKPTDQAALFTVDYPSDVLVDVAGDRIFLSEPRRNQIVVTDLNGYAETVFGSGTSGFRDGRRGNAQFSLPGRLAFDRKNQHLYVVDEGNLAIRRIDLKTEDITTVLGNGNYPEEPVMTIDSTTVGLPLPTDITFANGKLFITMTNAHQVWEYDPMQKRARAAFGNGNEKSLDGVGGLASFHHPTRITHTSNGELLVLDHGTQKIRKLSNDGSVVTLPVAWPDNENAELTDIAWSDGVLFVASASEHGIIRVEEGESSWLCGGTYGSEEGKGKKASFMEIAALYATGNGLHAIDIHSHRLLDINPKKGKVKAIEVTNYGELFRNINAYASGDQIRFEEIYVKDGVSSIYINVKLSDDYEWVKSGRNEIRMDVPKQNRLLSSDPTRGFIEFEAMSKEMFNNASVQFVCTVRHKPTGTVIFRPFLVLIPMVEDLEYGERNHDLNWRPFDGFQP
jgi:DNA-binding beta-propeller fold protein YncE